jgi:Na+-translocating ferredoxin:NAD+ oxidoreductase RnfG subunit
MVLISFQSLIKSMNNNNFIIKLIIFIVIGLLLTSFTSVKWKENKKFRIKIHKSISETFNSGDYIISLSENDSEITIITENNSIIGYMIVSTSFSKNTTFDYFIIYNNKAEILKVEVLKYRENYGYEICNKKWLNKFIGLSFNSEFELNNKVDGISGATISVNSLKNSVFKQTQILKRVINE